MKDRVIQEAKRIEQENGLNALGHSISAEFWSSFNLIIGIPTVIIAAIAGSIALLNIENASIIVGLLAIVVTGLTTMTTFLDPRSKASSHEIAANKFEVLRSRARLLYTIDAIIQNDTKELSQQLKVIAEEKADLHQDSPTVIQLVKSLAKKRYVTELQYLDNSAKSFGIQVETFDNIAAAYSFVANKMLTAKESIADITWGSRTEYRTTEETRAYQEYINSVEEVCSKGTIKYREVSSLANHHYLKKSINLIKKGYYSYHLGHYDISPCHVPLISYIVIDSLQAIMGFYRIPFLPGDEEVYLNVTNPMMLNLLNDYFETLWVGSIKIKEGNDINYKYLDLVKSNLNYKD